MPTRVHRPSGVRLSTDLIARWAKISTTIAADLFGGRTLVDPAIRPIRSFAGRPRLAGSIITAWCEPADYGPVHHAIAVAEPGDVIVVEAGGRLDAAMIGGLLCGSAVRKGIVGVVVNGAVRDTGILTQLENFAVFARGITPRGPSTMDRGVVNASMVFGGVSVAPGDLMLGDDDGLVLIPRDQAEDYRSQALNMSQAEEEWERALAQGRTTLEVFRVPDAIQA